MSRLPGPLRVVPGDVEIHRVAAAAHVVGHDVVVELERVQIDLLHRAALGRSRCRPGWETRRRLRAGMASARSGTSEHHPRRTR